MTDVPEVRWATTVDGASIAYEDYGRGPRTLVLVDGWFSHLEVAWESPPLARMLRRYAKTFRVLRFDQRGVGMSDRLSGAPDLDAQMDDIRAVMDAAGVEAASLAANGWVAPALAAFFAATHPDRTQALWLDGPIHYAAADDYPWGQSEAAWQEWVDRFCPRWGSAASALEFAHDCFAENTVPFDDPAFLRWLAKLARFAATPTSIAHYGQMWHDTDVRGVLSTICVPTATVIRREFDDADIAAVRYLAARIPGCIVFELPTPGHEPWTQDEYVAALERFVTAAMNEEAVLDRVLATVLFTDVVSSTDRIGEIGDARWKRLLEQHNAVVRGHLARYRGTEVKTTGDGFLATFDGPGRAVKCAQGICAAVKALGIEVRAGCHTGELELTGADVGGVGVHIGARVAALAGPSEVLVSSTVRDLVAGSGLRFEDRGEHTLKGVPEPWRLYAAVPAASL